MGVRFSLGAYKGHPVTDVFCFLPPERIELGRESERAGSIPLPCFSAFCLNTFMTLDPHLFWAAEMDPHTPAIDVHGFLVHSAIHEVDLFIDKQIMRGSPVIKIIHGAGTGTLRREIRTLLSKHPQVAHFKDSERPGETGAVLYAAIQ